MYKTIIRSILFRINPEIVHNLVTRILKIFSCIPGSSFLLRKKFSCTSPALHRKLFGLYFPNPVGMAAGFDKNAEFYNELADFGFAFVEIGTVTPRPQPGNEKPRLFRLTKDNALINRMGFNNKGVEYAVNKLRKKHKVIIGGNIGKNTDTQNCSAEEDYEICFRKLYDFVDYFVVNVSCPNVSNLKELQDKESLSRILKKIIKVRNEMPVMKSVLLKIAPDLNDNQLDDVIEVVQKEGIDGIVATNTSVQRDNLLSEDLLIQKLGQGGLSGQPIRKRSTEIIKYIADKTRGKLPIIGVGGIMNEYDALEKLKAGASLVQIYTGFIYEGPGLIKKINQLILKEFTDSN